MALYEQGPLPNPLASSCDQHRLIRFTYGAMTGYARMVVEAYAAWERLWADLGRSHYVASGTLVLARAAEDRVEQSIACLQQMDLPVERWTAADLARRLPFLDLGTPRCALYTPTGGVLFAERILRDLAGLLAERGVALHSHTPVTELDPARAAIRTADGRADRGRCAGGRGRPLDAGAAAGARGPRHPVAPGGALSRAAGRAAGGLGGGADAARPDRGGRGRLLRRAAGCRHRAQGRRPRLLAAAAIPTGSGRRAQASWRPVLALAGTRLPELARYRVIEAKTCFYSLAEGERFIVERHAQAWVLAGFSGHGFKFGALLGERVAAAVAGEQSADELAAWAAGRR